MRREEETNTRRQTDAQTVAFPYKLLSVNKVGKLVLHTG